MSADSHTVCPRCHPDLVTFQRPHGSWGDPGVIDHAAEDLGYDRSVRENIEYYLLAKDHKLVLVFDYRADCWTCNWHFDTVHESPVTIRARTPGNWGDSNYA